MKKPDLLFVTALSVLTYSISVASAEVESLRGHDLTSMSSKPIRSKVVSVEGGIMRSYELQPPMVPHAVDKYEINLKNNGCMKCHSETTYEREKAPKIGDSHYVSRDGKVLKSLASRRYFCNQCHAPQVDAKPLIENKFVGAK